MPHRTILSLMINCANYNHFQLSDNLKQTLPLGSKLMLAGLKAVVYT